jgi:hypothetical protein
MPVDVPSEPLEALLEEIEIAHIVQERTLAGPATSLSGLAEGLGLNPDDYK